MRVAPGDYADVMAMELQEALVSPAEVQLATARWRAELGLDRPIYVQYVKWVGGFARGDFGYSFVTQEPVTKIFLARIGPTIQLAIMAVVLLYLWALPLGVLSALKPNSLLDHGARMFAVFGLSLPSFWIGVMILFALVNITGSLPSIVRPSLLADPLGNLNKMIWPALTLAFSGGAGIVRLTRSQMLEVLREDYIRTAYSKGLSPRVVMVRHALRNALIPVITISGIQLGHLLAGAVIIEAVFNIQGIGTGLIDGIRYRDYDVVGWFILFFSTVFLCITLLVDMLYAVIDPRIRYT